jgi:hypothetical protein
MAAITDLGFVEAPRDAALAVGQLSGYSRIHSKSLAVSGVGKDCYLFGQRHFPSFNDGSPVLKTV